MDIWSEIILLVLLFWVSAFFSLLQMSVISLKRSKMRQMADDGDLRAKRLVVLLEQPGRFLAAMQFAGLAISLMAAGSAALIFVRYFHIRIVGSISDSHVIPIDWAILLIIVLIIAFILQLFGQILPRHLAVAKAEKIAISMSWLLFVVFLLLKPLVSVLNFASDSIVGMFGIDVSESDHQVTEEEIKMMLDVGEEEGLFRETGKEMINSIFEFDDTILREVMTPRTEITALPVSAAIEDVVSAVRYSRIPVYQDNIDNIIGILYVKDLLSFLKDKDKSTFNITELMRPAYYVPDAKKTDELFKEMQQKNIHMAVVIDEYGGTAGLVTIEDLLEEIVGNIFDEFDEKEDDVEKISDDTYIVSGRLSIEEISELLDVQIPDEDDYETIAGFVLGLLGKMPVVNDMVQYEDVTFTIVSLDEKRIEKIKVIKS